MTQSSQRSTSGGQRLGDFLCQASCLSEQVTNVLNRHSGGLCAIRELNPGHRHPGPLCMDELMDREQGVLLRELVLYCSGICVIFSKKRDPPTPKHTPHIATTRHPTPTSNSTYHAPTPAQPPPPARRPTAPLRPPPTHPRTIAPHPPGTTPRTHPPHRQSITQISSTSTQHTAHNHTAHNPTPNTTPQ